MRSTLTAVVVLSLLGAVVFSGQVARAQRGGGGGAATPGAPQAFPQPAPAREVTVAAIPGVVAAGAQWKLVWGGSDNADGLVGTPDGGLLFAQEQPNRVSKLDANDKLSSYLENSNGTGALAFDSKGRLWGAQRSCTDPGRAGECKDPTAIGILAPAADRKVLADNFEGKSLGRVNDLCVAKDGGVYFNGTGTYYVNPAGKVSMVGMDLRTNGILLSRDEKTLYVTNGMAIVALDVQADGTTTNQHEFGKLEAGGGGDGLTIDSEGRLYVSSGMGVQVLGPDGKYLGLIPTPRGVVSIAFSGPGKKTLYMVGSGAVGPDGKDLRTPDGVRNNAKSIYKIQLLAAGFAGRAK